MNFSFPPWLPLTSRRPCREKTTWNVNTRWRQFSSAKATHHRALATVLGLATLAGFSAATVRAQPPPAGAVMRRPEPVQSFRSFSGQFVVHQFQASRGARPFALVTNRTLVTLEPTLLTVSCERIKQQLGRELGSTAPWQGKIFVFLYPAVTENDPITITCELLKDGWRYRLDLPDTLAPARLTRAMVQLLLLEMANRTATDRSAEIPAWLAEGLTRQLQVTSEKEIILPAPGSPGRGIAIATSQVDARRGHPLEHTHLVLSSYPPLSFEQLSWATPEQYGGPQGELYTASAQLLVEELLELNQGHVCLQAMLAELPRHYNWQLAFLRGFRPYFQRPLDIEKWWALRWVHFTGRELEQTWPLQESWQKLNEAVHAPVELRSAPNELPLSAEVSLQTIIREWDRARQTQVLQDRIQELKLVRQRVAPQVVALADGYCVVLERFLRDRDKSSLLYLFRKGPALRRASEQAVKELDALDTQRLAMRPAPKPLAARNE